MNHAAELVSLYNQIDRFLRKVLKKKDHVPFAHLINEYEANNPWWQDAEFCRSIAHLRNILVHQFGASGYPLEPSMALLSKVTKVLETLTGSLNAHSGCFKSVESVSMRTTLNAVLEKIDAYQYSQFPVLEKERCVGLITESGIARWLAKNRTADHSLSSLMSVTVREILPRDEKRKSYKIIPIDENVHRIRHSFASSALLEAMLLVDRSTKPYSLKGIITRWDLPTLA